MKLIKPEKADLTTWFLGQISLLEQQTGKKVSILELEFDGLTGDTGINLGYGEAPTTE